MTAGWEFPPSHRGGRCNCEMTAKDIMTREVVTVTPETPVEELAKILAERRISGAPVVDQAGNVVGIATEADIIAKGKEGKVADIMTREVISVTEDTPVEEVARVLAEKGIKRVPVLREGKLVGIVSRADIVRAMAQR